MGETSLPNFSTIGKLDIQLISVYTINMTFEWNNQKAKQNALKHGISFKTATFAFDDPYALILEDSKHSTHETRQWLIGDSGASVLVVVFTIRPPGQTIRIISARRANRKERRSYEKNKRV